MEKNHYIDGIWQKGEGELFQSINPATDQVIWQGSHGTKSEVDNAVFAARKAFPEWVKMPLSERLDILMAFSEKLKENTLHLAECISMETGKPLWESKTEVAAMIGKVAMSHKAYVERTHQTEIFLTGQKSVVKFKPHGVVAILGPFNFPGHLPNGHIIPALLAGNTVVFKPSELTPLVAKTILSYWHEAKLPPGVLNMIQGGGETGQMLIEQPDINGVFFTGSFETGKKIHQFFAGKPEIIVVLEMGGNNPLIVWNVGNLSAAAYFTIQSAYLTAGQRCVNARRLIIPRDSFGDEFLEVLTKQIKSMKIGSYTEEPEPFMGPVISHEAVLKVLNFQQQLVAEGGTILLESKRLNSHCFLSPGLIDVTNNQHSFDEEIFGPLLQVIRVDDIDEAITMANATKFGLAAGLFSDNEDLFEHFYKHIKGGVVNWNCQLTGASSHAPFGGVGCSGNHRPSAYYAADYCAYPVAGLTKETLKLPEQLTPGIYP